MGYPMDDQYDDGADAGHGDQQQQYDEPSGAQGYAQENWDMPATAIDDWGNDEQQAQPQQGYADQQGQQQMVDEYGQQQQQQQQQQQYDQQGYGQQQQQYEDPNDGGMGMQNW